MKKLLFLLLTLISFTAFSQSLITTGPPRLRIMSGYFNPNNSVIGYVGEIYMQNDNQTGKIWQKVAGSNNATGWVQLVNTGNIPVINTDWSLSGNSGTTNANYCGTSDGAQFTVGEIADSIKTVYFLGIGSHRIINTYTGFFNILSTTGHVPFTVATTDSTTQVLGHFTVFGDAAINDTVLKVTTLGQVGIGVSTFLTPGPIFQVAVPTMFGDYPTKYFSPSFLGTGNAISYGKDWLLYNTNYQLQLDSNIFRYKGVGYAYIANEYYGDTAYFKADAHLYGVQAIYQNKHEQFGFNASARNNVRPAFSNIFWGSYNPITSTEVDSAVVWVDSLHTYMKFHENALTIVNDSITYKNGNTELFNISNAGNIEMPALPSFDNNAAAVSGSLPANYLYVTTGVDITLPKGIIMRRY